MGRATNSFVSYVGHAEETIHEDRVDLPEKGLWVAVLCRAALDAFKGPPKLDMSRKATLLIEISTIIIEIRLIISF